MTEKIEFNDDWVVSDARKTFGKTGPLKGSLVGNNAPYTKEGALKLAQDLNRMVYDNTFGQVLPAYAQLPVGTEITGPFFAYSMESAKKLGLL